jgi:hypothetical protein
LLLDNVLQGGAKMSKYQLPVCLKGKISQESYERWLDRKAMTHKKRDSARGNKSATKKKYKIVIHNAVEESNGKDAYTKEELNWCLLSRYNNEASKKLGRKYKETFALLPTVDHVGDGTGPANFKICAWRTNDAKSDLPYDEFLELCRKVVTAAKQKRK